MQDYTNIENKINIREHLHYCAIYIIIKYYNNIYYNYNILIYYYNIIKMQLKLIFVKILKEMKINE